MFTVEIVGNTDKKMNKQNAAMISPLGGNCSYVVVNLSRPFPINTWIYTHTHTEKWNNLLFYDHLSRSIIFKLLKIVSLLMSDIIPLYWLYPRNEIGGWDVSKPRHMYRLLIHVTTSPSRNDASIYIQKIYFECNIKPCNGLLFTQLFMGVQPNSWGGECGNQRTPKICVVSDSGHSKAWWGSVQCWLRGHFLPWQRDRQSGAWQDQYVLRPRRKPQAPVGEAARGPAARCLLREHGVRGVVENEEVWRWTPVAHLKVGSYPWSSLNGLGGTLGLRFQGFYQQGAWDHWDYDPWLLILSLRLSGPGKIQVIPGNEYRRPNSLCSFYALMEDAVWLWFFAQYKRSQGGILKRKTKLILNEKGTILFYKHEN